MAQYIGFSTINARKPKTSNPIGLNSGIETGAGSISRGIVWGKKFRTTDAQLVVQNYINAMNIRRGEKVGQPEYGTRLWDFIFDPNTSEVRGRIETELRRIANLDPRLELNRIATFPREDGIVVEIELAVTPFNNPAIISVFFERETNFASLV